MKTLQESYSILGLKPGCTVGEVQKSYRNLAKLYHPDVNKSVDANKKFSDIHEAFKVIEESVKNAQQPTQLKQYDDHAIAESKKRVYQYFNQILDMTKLAFDENSIDDGNIADTIDDALKGWLENNNTTLVVNIRQLNKLDRNKIDIIQELYQHFNLSVYVNKSSVQFMLKRIRAEEY